MTGLWAALQDWLVGYTLERVGRLHIKLGCVKGRVGGLPFSASRPALFRSPPARPSVCVARQPIHVFHLETWPSSPAGPPALQLVLSADFTFFVYFFQAYVLSLRVSVRLALG